MQWKCFFLAFPSASKDRVRGEYLATWGMAEAKVLGIDVALLTSCAVPPQQLPSVSDHLFGGPELPLDEPRPGPFLRRMRSVNSGGLRSHRLG
jgi:hypothetical protein